MNVNVDYEADLSERREDLQTISFEECGEDAGRRCH
jgi:hypothetical protein